MASTHNIITGKRKNAIARVYLTPGEGSTIVNGRASDTYFPRETWRFIIRQPFSVTETQGKYNVVANISGGGLTGQAGALRHGISKALLEIEPHLRDQLKKAGFLTRDARKKERKKFGQKGARAKFQFSKR
ncbi:MAG: 30S ribosomal protein S9 [Nitrospiria bacterium]